MTLVAWFNFYMCWVVKYKGPHPLLQSTLVFFCVLGFENSSWMWLKHDHPDECGPGLKNIVVRDSDLTTRAYSV